MTKRVIIHIGHLKTGSSSIQNFLWDNRLILKGKGVLYPEKALAHERFIGIRHYHLGINPISNSKYWTQTLAEIESSSKTAVLSYEGFIRLERDEIDFVKHQLSRHKVKVICYLRRQDEFIQSHYAEMIKNQGVTIPFTQFISRSPNYCNYMPMILLWINAFNLKNICVRNFTEQASAKEGIIRDFLEQCKIDPSGLTFPKTQSNKSLSAEQLQIMYDINHSKSSLANKRKYAAMITSKKVKKTRPVFFTNEQAMLFVNRYKEDNEWLQDTFPKSFRAPFSTEYNYPDRPFRLTEDHQ